MTGSRRASGSAVGRFSRLTASAAREYPGRNARLLQSVFLGDFSDVENIVENQMAFVEPIAGAANRMGPHPYC